MEGIAAAPELGDAVGGGQQQPGGEVAEGDDDRRLDELDLRLEIGPARLDLVRLRVPVAGWPALDHVGDVGLCPGYPDLLLHQPVEELSRAAHERLTFEILLPAGTFPDE